MVIEYLVVLFWSDQDGKALRFDIEGVETRASLVWAMEVVVGQLKCRRELEEKEDAFLQYMRWPVPLDKMEKILNWICVWSSTFDDVNQSSGGKELERDIVRVWEL